MLTGLKYIVFDDSAPESGLEILARRIEDISRARRARESMELARRQRQQQTIQTAALVLAVVGIVLLAMGE